MKVVTTFYRRVIIVARSLHDEIPDLQPCLPVTIAVLTEKDLPAYNQFRPDQFPGTIQARLARADRCYAVWHEGHIIHVGWVTTKGLYEPYLRRSLILQPGDIFLFDHFTLSAYRGLDLASARGIRVLRDYRREGYHRSIGVIAVENKPAFGPVKAVGYHPIGMFRCVRLGPWQWDWQERWSDEPFPFLIKKR